MPTSGDSNYACRIIRSDRPCLVCPAKMDLVEAHPRFSLFSGLPLCSSESIDCLDCPSCGFSTTTTDYEYLQICKIQRHGMFSGSRRNRKNASGRSSSSRKQKGMESPSNDSSRVCTACNASLSSKWQFCPGCGAKCDESSAPTSFISVPKVITHSTECASKDTTANMSSDASMELSEGSRSSGIIKRMVTPPKRHAVESDISQGSL